MNPNFKVIFQCVTGSHLYGTATPESDKDYRGVFIPPKEYYLGFLNKVEQIESHNPDSCLWELKKFLKLCTDNNPNILELLFVPPEFSTMISWEWNKIVAFRHEFLSSKIKHTFSGYAVLQLHRIKQHREWLLNPPKKHPERNDFGLPDYNVVTRDQLNAFDELNSKGVVLNLNEATLEVLKREKQYINALKYWDNYQTWKKERNPNRAKMEADFGYDGKHASHLVRLLYEGKELLTTRYLTFPRPEVKELRAIRAGEYTYEQLISTFIPNDVDGWFDSFKDKIVLPHDPDRKKIDNLCIFVLKNALDITTA